MAKSFIIAEDMRHADLCIHVVGGWKKQDYGVWRDEVGQKVVFTSRPSDIDGCDPGTIVYLGWGWKVRVTQADMVTWKKRGYVVEELRNA